MVLIDFGTAVRYTGEKLKDLAGSPEYIAPEVIVGDYDSKCDIWSVGALAYMVLCGAPPFSGEKEDVLFKNIQKGEVEFFLSCWKSVSPEAKDFITSLLVIDSSKRPTAT